MGIASMVFIGLKGPQPLIMEGFILNPDFRAQALNTYHSPIYLYFTINDLKSLADLRLIFGARSLSHHMAA